MISFANAQKKLAAVSELTAGWYFGEGEAISQKAIRVANDLLTYAENKLNLHEMEVFPTTEGGIEVHFYKQGDTLEIHIPAHGALSANVEKAGEPMERIPNLTVGMAVIKLFEFSPWSSTASYTHITGHSKKGVTQVPGSGSTARAYQLYASPAHGITRISKENTSAIDLRDCIQPSQKISSQSYGSWIQNESESEYAWSTPSEQEETAVIMM